LQAVAGSCLLLRQEEAEVCQCLKRKVWIDLVPAVLLLGSSRATIPRPFTLSLMMVAFAATAAGVEVSMIACSGSVDLNSI